MRAVGDVAAEHLGAAGLNLARAGDDAEQRRLADAVRPDQADHASGGQRDTHRVERRRAPVALRDIVQARDRPGQSDHCVTRPCRAGGQAVPELVRI